MNSIYRRISLKLLQPQYSRLYYHYYKHPQNTLYKISSSDTNKELFINNKNKFQYKGCDSLAIVKHFTSSTVVNEDKTIVGGIFKKIMKRVGMSDNSKTRMRVASYILYETVADTLNYGEMFQRFELPNTFNSWFLITELHVWMLMVRAMAEGSEKNEDGRFIRNCIVEAMWADVNVRAKKLSLSNPSAVRSQIYDLSQQFQAALIAYDEGLMGDDRVLASSLWRRFFQRDCDNYEDLELLVKYVRKNMFLLDTLSRKDFGVKPTVKWLSLDEL